MNLCQICLITDSKIKDALDASGMNKHDLEKNKKKVLDLIAEMQSKGHAVNLNIGKNRRIQNCHKNIEIVPTPHFIGSVTSPNKMNFECHLPGVI